jgi:hypothetical protein
MSQPPLLRVEQPAVVFGDIHGLSKCMLLNTKLTIPGQIRDLFGHMASVGWPDEETPQKYVFLGDLVDRGKHSIETVSLLMALMLKYPKQVGSTRIDSQRS